MARKCVCHITHEKGTTDTFYRAENGKYYKSEEVYRVWNKENEDRKAVVDRFAVEFLNYQPGQVFPTILTKKLKELEFYGYDVVNKTIDESYNSIQYAIQHKDFKNDVGKISYIFAIIKNNINDVYKRVLKEEKEQKSTFKIDTSVDIDNIQTQHTEKNIQKWLEDDDWL